MVVPRDSVARGERDHGFVESVGRFDVDAVTAIEIGHFQCWNRRGRDLPIWLERLLPGPLTRSVGTSISAARLRQDRFLAVAPVAFQSAKGSPIAPSR
jgi:hypothetical protein